ncbi:MAG: response regulator [Opitutaceae bacterium]|nr:response regulator [Opitutaceae bacterium]
MMVSEFLLRCRAHRLVRPITVMVVIGASLVTWAPVRADDEALPFTDDPDVVWRMAPEDRGRMHRLRLEGRVNFIDNSWNNMWMEGPVGARYVQLSGRDLPLRNGQRVLIEGTFVPARGLDAETVRVTVLEEEAPVQPLDTSGRFGDIDTFTRRVVTTTAYVDDQQLIDAEHLRLYLMVEDRPAIGWVAPDDPAKVPDLRRKFVRLQAVYSGRLGPTGTESTVELWIARERDIEVTGDVATAASFDIPATETTRINEVPRGTIVRVRGRLQRRDTGVSIVVRDAAGEVTVQSLQRERLPLGTEVEAVGRVAVNGARWILEAGLFRVAPSDAANPPEPAADEGAAPDGPLRRIEQVRALNRQQAERGRSVDLYGGAVWSMPGVDFFYLHDMSGGVRVRRLDGMSYPPLQRSVRVIGRTRVTPEGVEVEADQVIDVDAMGHPKPHGITVEQARTGSEDGQWVGIRGFLREMISEGDWRWIHVTSPDGEFVAHLQSPVPFVATPGSLIRVHGVCESVRDEAGRITGTLLRVPFLHDITVEEDAPADLFDLPIQALDGLRQLGTVRDMVRARVAGTVLDFEPGEGLVIQEGATAARVLTRDMGPFEAGDRVEAVGIVGRAGARAVLREAVVHRVGPGRAPETVEVSPKAPLARGLDLRLVRMHGVVADIARQPGRVRLTLHEDGTYFECVLDGGGGLALDPAIQAGAVVGVTGLYQLEYSDAREPRGFQLHARAERDIVLLRAARFWTVRRLVAVSGVFAGAFVVAGGAALFLRRRVVQQTAEIRRQLERQAGLEAELERAHRFKALGLLAGGLAHDFNNLLTSIMGNASVALFDAEVAKRAGECLRDIEDSAGRAHQLTQQLVTFAKGGDPMLEPLDLACLVSGVVRRVLAGARARAEVVMPPDLWPVHADRGQLTRALENIIMRGRVDTTARGGVVSITATNRAEGSGGTPADGAGRCVEIELRGCGGPVPPDKLRIFFDPYATTTSDSDRFSMAIVYSIVKRHGGRITIESSEIEGAIFRLWIPAADALPAPTPATAPTAVEVAASRALVHARVLLMDDEETIRRLGERCLRHLGCEVQVAADGGECVRIYQAAMQGGRRFDAVILDLTVPGGLGGRETIQALKAIDPAVRAIVSSGYSNDPVMAHYREHGFAAVVPKPYSVDVLTLTLQRVLAAADV